MRCLAPFFCWSVCWPVSVDVTRECVHEPSSSGDHDVLHIGQRGELGSPDEYRGVLPDTIVLEKALPPVGAFRVKKGREVSQGRRECWGAGGFTIRCSV